MNFYILQNKTGIKSLCLIFFLTLCVDCYSQNKKAEIPPKSQITKKSIKNNPIAKVANTHESPVVEAIKELAVRAIKEKYGDGIGNAFGFLMFGGYGVPGLVDGATLVAKANEEAGIELTEKIALSLVTDLAKVGIQKAIQAKAASGLKKAGITAEVFASTTMLVLTSFLQPTDIAQEPIDPKKNHISAKGEGGTGGGKNITSSSPVGRTITSLRRTASQNGLSVGEVTVTEEGSDGKQLTIRFKVYPQ